ncbi:MAG: catalase/peroxidase HPI [Myxococcota bacterium]
MFDLIKSLTSLSSLSLAGLLLVACANDGKNADPTSTASPPEEATVPVAKPEPGEKYPAGQPKPNRYWWPDQVDLTALRKNAERPSPYGDDFNYAEAFKTINLPKLKAELVEVMQTSQDWWPADYGNYGPFFIRMAWHAAGTYRTADGRGGAEGGQLRFEPLNSWPDNTNLDKARRLLWPIKQKYGRKLSWGDLMVLAGTVAMESMGMETYGFAGGREDDWEPEMVYWGPEGQMLASARHDGTRKLEQPLGASRMGLIYVNPEGPNGSGEILAAAKEIRQTFARMAMNDEETVALIAGGHTFGKAHGAHKDECLKADPGGSEVAAQGIGWKNECGSGKGSDTHTSGLEGAWTAAPAKWTHQYLSHLYSFEWVASKSPAGKLQFIPKDGAAANLVPDAHDPDKRHAPIMFVTDLALKEDPAYRKVSERFLKDPDAFEKAFARAWFKLTHRDMGPRWRYVGTDVPEEELVWQDPLPAIEYALIDGGDVKALKEKILATQLTTSDLIRTAWSSAASYRHSDMRGGADGGRLRLAPQKDWAVNNPKALANVLSTLEQVRKEFNESQATKQVSLADLIVLGGAAAVERAAKEAGVDVEVPFRPGRADATPEQTDVTSFAALEPRADGFRNFYGDSHIASPAGALIDRADLLDLTVPEMTVLVGGMRALGANYDGSKHGVFTDRPGVLSNDFFVNLLDMGVTWSPSEATPGVFEGRDGKSGDVRWTATEVDLVFGSNAELRSMAEMYASVDGAERFAQDFVDAWVKVMNSGRPPAARPRNG